MIALRDYQIPAVEAIASTKRGIIQSPAGSGKTVIAAAALSKWAATRARLAARRMRVAWIANTTDQLDQATRALSGFPTIAQTCEITLACYASGLSLAQFDIVILDECHHIAAPEFRKMLDNGPRFRWGFTATPHRADALANDVFALIGSIVHVVERAALVDAGQLAKARVIIYEPNQTGEFEVVVKEHAQELFRKWRFGAQEAAHDMAIRSIKSLTARTQKIDRPTLYQIIAEVGLTDESSFIGAFGKFPKGHPHRSTLWKMLISLAEEEIEHRALWIACQKFGVFENDKRNAAIVEISRTHAKDSHLIIIGSIDHGTALQEKIPNSLVVHSKIGAKRRRAAIAAFSSGELQTMIATSLADEGLDVPRANVLTLSAAGRSASKAEQRTGRVLRTFKEKTHGTINDFMDTSHYLLLAQSKKRISLYKSLGYEIQFAQKEGGLI